MKGYSKELIETIGIVYGENSEIYQLARMTSLTLPDVIHKDIRRIQNGLTPGNCIRLVKQLGSEKANAKIERWHSSLPVKRHIEGVAREELAEIKKENESRKIECERTK